MDTHEDDVKKKRTQDSCDGCLTGEHRAQRGNRSEIAASDFNKNCESLDSWLVRKIRHGKIHDIPGGSASLCRDPNESPMRKWSECAGIGSRTEQPSTICTGSGDVSICARFCPCMRDFLIPSALGHGSRNRVRGNPVFTLCLAVSLSLSFPACLFHFMCHAPFLVHMSKLASTSTSTHTSTFTCTSTAACVLHHIH